MISSIQDYCKSLILDFDQIPISRKEILHKISDYISQKRKENKPVQLVYICTHNSRRSHFGQIWAHVAVSYFGIKNVSTYSGGTEATAFHVHAIEALERIGFIVKAMNENENTLYHVFFDLQKPPMVCFSKEYNDTFNPQKDFVAIMTCGEAEENCPFIPGTEMKVATTYEDPKKFDDSPLQDLKYDERCRQIALEIFYMFSLVK